MATSPNPETRLRSLPAVGLLLERPSVRRLIDAHGRASVVRAVREAVAEARQQMREGSDGAVTDEAIVLRLRAGAGGSLREVINATGIIVHTNLGRAPLAEEAIEASARAARAYVTLEYDLDRGARGDRHAHARDLLVELTGAEDALVVNNNAAAVLLALAALAAGRQVVVSRGELVEIGGGFRIPEVLAQSGAHLVEVGTTNRTHASDYERAICADTALILKVHRSNFALVGFTHDVGVAELADLAHARGIPLVHDAGSGCIASTAAAEPTVLSLVRAGADVVTFSGDKLLGGPQAGIVVGKRDLVGQMRKHPLLRALRPDKMCLAALHATLALWRDSPERLPILRMQTASKEGLTERARALASMLDAIPSCSVEVVRTSARIGGGAAPTVELEGRGLRFQGPDAASLASWLRAGDPPVIARIEDGAVVVDLTAVAPEDDRRLGAALRAALEHADD